ncbi:DUF2076 domain-containing protein [Pararhizobium haloflavum]|uniref:DUF2076 domain-containing protein n=1 Tax=Pararhizobium haloflavum TaxID=2037914 RepID=UPI000C177ED6|nr:DUF2076 domain-containing protein [Pararhizobium haloflavum]
MDRNDQHAIEDLFGKLKQVEAQGNPRDDDAEHLIATQISGQPAAPYYMAQTIIVQEQALNAAQQRIEELERQQAGAPNGGGFLGGLFGTSRPRGSVPSVGRPRTERPGAGAASALGQGMDRRGGGFLAGAAQTAMGVAGGVLLGNAIAGMFLGDEASAATADAGPDEDMGGDFGDMGDMDF